MSKKKLTMEDLMNHVDILMKGPCSRCKGVMFVRVPGKCGHWKPCPKCNKEIK